MCVVFVIDQFEVFYLEREELLDFRIDLHLRQCVWRALELLLKELDLVGVDVDVAKGVNEALGHHVVALCQHHHQ